MGMVDLSSDCGHALIKSLFLLHPNCKVRVSIHCDFSPSCLSSMSVMMSFREKPRHVVALCDRPAVSEKVKKGPFSQPRLSKPWFQVEPRREPFVSPQVF